MVENISARELDSYVNAPGFMVIDLRMRKEYREGHIKGAVNVPSGEFGRKLPDLNTGLVLYCQRGGMSMAVARELSRKGYRVKTVVGGIRAYRGKNLVK